MITEYFNPVQTVHGAGALSSLPRLLAGRKAVLVTFPEARAVGLLERIEQVLGDRLVGVIDQVRPNPDVAGLRDHRLGRHSLYGPDDVGVSDGLWHSTARRPYHT